MARTHRYSTSSENEVPKMFGKSNDYENDPHKLKKNGSGKYNWGNAYDEIDDFEASSSVAFANSRRRSNSSGLHHSNLTNEPGFDSVFDEEE